MKNFCTLSDSNYLIKGLTMYDSLVNTQCDFMLHYLCLDIESFNKLIDLNLESIKPYNLDDLIEGDINLQSARNKLTYRDFCFALASYFSKYLLEKELDSILYMDSDLFFYNDLDLVYNEIRERSVGIIRHRHVERGHFVGEYNVGIVYFKNDQEGRFCCTRWWELVSDPSNKYAQVYGTCGDQKYLELFDSFIPEDSICVIDEESSHVAPFNFNLYDFSKFSPGDRVVGYKGKTHKITLCHFMKFKPVFESNTYFPTDEPHNQRFMDIPAVKFLYDEYFLSSFNTTKKYNLQ